MQREWRIAPENDDFVFEHGQHFFCNSRYMLKSSILFGDLRYKTMFGVMYSAVEHRLRNGDWYTVRFSLKYEDSSIENEDSSMIVQQK